MLSLTRKVGETIVISDNIEVVILSVQGERIKIGIVAPKDVTVYRKEIYEQIKLENIQAMTNKRIDLSKLI